jgi:serine O-acetyltransferase
MSSLPPTRASLRASKLSYEPGEPLATGDQNENPEGVGLFELLAEDFRTNGSDARSPGFWALAVHRLGNARMAVKNQALRAPLSLAYRAAHFGIIAAFGIDLPYNSKIGRRLRIGHHGCLHMGARVVGDDCHIHHSATIGLAKRTERSTAPIIGDRVEIGPGACIVGGIEVGDDCYIGANTVLADSLPRGTAVLGVPARVVKLVSAADDGKLHS